MRRVLTTGAAALLVLATGSAVAAPQSRPATKRPFKVTSSIAGMKVLPRRIRWIAKTSLPVSQVTEVDFLIDGKLAWVEHNAPYVYGDDTDWLVTSWLTPGSHRFSVRALAVGRRPAVTTTIAAVAPAGPPPTELDNTRWTVVKSDPGGGPSGTWTLTVDRTGWRIADPAGGRNWIDVAYPAPGRITTRGGIWTRPHSDQEGNGWCEDTNAPVQLTWKVDGDSLTLSHPVGNCDGLGDFLSTTWTRAT